MIRSRPRLVALFLLAGAHAASADPSTSFTLSGAVDRPTVFDQSALNALPQTTRTETYTSSGKPVTDTFTGPTTYSVITSGGLTTDPSVKNASLRDYVIATGSDGYKAAFSVGEIDPRFGNKPDLIATSDTLGRLPGADGVARATASGDKAGGRYVSNLVDLKVGVAPTQPGGGGGPTSSFTVGGQVQTPTTFTSSSLLAFKAYTQTVTYRSGSTSVTDTYTGALLYDVLSSTGFKTDPSIKNDILRQLVTVTGSDGYQVTFSLGELSPSFGNSGVLVAYSDTAGQIAGGAGFARLVVPGDVFGGRYVSNLYSATVFDPTISPVAVPGPITGAGLVPLLALAGGWFARRRRKALAA